jgi:Zn-dependent metalloprotease
MKKTTLLLVSMSVFCAFDSFSQTFLGTEAEKKIQSAKWIEYSNEFSRPIFVEFNSNTANFRLAVANPVEIMKEILSLKINDDLVSYRQERDDIGFTHTRYQQTFKGIPVQGAQYIAHQKAGLLDYISGNIFDVNENISVNASLSEATALSKAIAFVGAKKYKWEDQEELAIMREAFSNPNYNYDPKGKLVIYAVNNDYAKADFRLAYQFNIFAAEPLSRANIYVDARTGEILGKEDLLHSADVQATAATRYSGTQQIMTEQNGATYRLSESGRGNGIQTMNLKGSTNVGTAVDFTNASTTWNLPGTDNASGDAHWATEMTYDYYLKIHNRNSIDNAGFKLINYVHYDKNLFNAYWNGQYMVYGDGSTNQTPLTACDIGGHEMTHGVTERSSGLAYQNESGALNESFSDIMGTCVEFYAKPNDANWDIGEDVGALRNMQDPKSHNQPDTYKGQQWYTGTADNGGVHTNSGVQNRWFYILVNGAQGTNDIGSAYNVTGIGIDKAAKITYRNLINLTSSSNYAATRAGALKAAKDLYGECSQEYLSTGNAWYAVGVGVKLECALVPVADFSANKTTSCDGTIQFTDKSSSSPTSWAWDFGDGTTATTQNPTHTYATSGKYTVKLTATNANGKDDESKTEYIIVTLMTAPTVKDAERCGPGTIKLTAAGSNNLNWYTTQTGGTSVYTGTDYSPNVTTTTTYYVESSVGGGPSQKVGPADNSTLPGGNFTTNADHGLKFDVLGDCILKSVKVYAGADGDRQIDVLDNAGAVVKTKTVNIPSGESRVTLDFDLVPGTQYFIKVAGTLVDLHRCNTGAATFPYTLAGYISITETDYASTAAGYYYYFFDWEIQGGGGCTSVRVPVTGTVNPDVAKPAITEDAQKVLNASVTGVTYQWFLNGLPITGATSQTYKPLQDGSYTVKATNTGNCSSTSEPYQFKVNGIAPNVLDAYVHIYPNPVSEAIFVDAPQLGNNTITVNVFSVIGKLVYQETYANNGQPHQVNLGTIEANGIYLIKIQSGSEQIIRKFNLNR